MHFSSALALARRPWPWPAGPSLGYASAEASGPRPGPLDLGRCLRKAFFSAHFSKAGLLILERQNIYLIQPQWQLENFEKCSCSAAKKFFAIWCNKVISPLIDSKLINQRIEYHSFKEVFY